MSWSSGWAGLWSSSTPAGFQWGILGRYDDLSYPSGTQGYTSNAKDDVSYYAERAGGAFSVLGTDLSQYLDNQTVGATWTYELSPASRFNVRDSWTVEVEVDADNADTGRFVTYGTAAANSLLSLRIAAGGVIEACLATGGALSVIGSLTLPGVSASDQRFIIAWSCEPNLYTTGASNALRNEIRAWNITAGTYAQSVFTSINRTFGTSDFVWWAEDRGGANTFTGTPHMCRFGAGRFRTATETHEDFVAETAAPSVSGAVRIEFPVFDASCDAAQQGQLVGPMIQMGAASVWCNGLRSLAPIVNEAYTERSAFVGSTLSPVAQYGRAAPDTDYTLLGPYLYCRHVPAYVSRLKCRVQVQQYRTSGATPDRLYFRVYSFNRPPNPTGAVTDKAAALIAHVSGTGVLEEEHGSGAEAGEWVDLGLCPIARNSEGHTWLVLAVRVQDLSGAPANQRFQIGAITIDPVAYD